MPRLADSSARAPRLPSRQWLQTEADMSADSWLALALLASAIPWFMLWIWLAADAEVMLDFELDERLRFALEPQGGATR
jgi:hypothetical protein